MTRSGSLLSVTYAGRATPEAGTAPSVTHAQERRAGRSRSSLALLVVGLLVVNLADVARAQPGEDGADPTPPGFYEAAPLSGWMTGGSSDRVHDIAQIGNTIYVAGTFGGVRPGVGGPVSAQSHLAAFDATTGAHLPAFDPVLDGTVYSLAVAPDGSRLYAAGAFTKVDGGNHRRVAALDPVDGDPLTDFSANTGGGSVRSIVVWGDDLYIGGNFGWVETETRLRLARLDALTGAVDPAWAPTAQVDAVLTMEIPSDGSRIYAGGRFDSVNGRPGSADLVALSPADGSILPGFAGRPGREVYDLVATDDGRVYAAEGGPGGRAEVYDDTGATLARWYTHGDVQAVEEIGDRIYFGGHELGPEQSGDVAVVDPDDLTRFDASLLDVPTNTGDGVWAFHATAGELWIGGQTTAPYTGFARYPPETTPPSTPIGVTAVASGRGPVPDVFADGESSGLGGATASANASTVAAAAHSGGGGVRVAATNAPGNVRWDDTVVPQGRQFASGRFWVRVNSRAANESVDLFTVANALGSRNFDFFVSATTGRFQWDIFNQATDRTSFAVTFGQWYLVEVRLEYQGSTHTARVRIDGIDQGTITSPGTPTTVASLTVGSMTNKTHSQDYDDIALVVGDADPGWLGAVEGGPATIHWYPVVDAVSGVRGYHIWRNGQWYGWTYAPGTTYVDPSPEPGAFYQIRAEDNAGNRSDWSTRAYLTGPCGHSPFADVPAWVADAVDWAFCLGFVAGYPDNSFGPNLDITRGQLARLLYRAAGSPAVSALPPHRLSDVPAWLERPVRWLHAGHHMTGYPDNTFRPNQPISRGQVTRAVFRTHGAPSGAPAHSFGDVPAWLAHAVSWATHDPDAAGSQQPLMTGYPDNTFRPDTTISRAQTTRLVCRTGTPTGTC